MLLSIPIKYWLGAIYELDILLCPSDCVLEFGSGGSTLFFARRCHEVYSYETDIDWHNSVRDILNRDTGVIASAVVYSYCPHVLGFRECHLFSLRCKCDGIGGGHSSWLQSQCIIRWSGTSLSRSSFNFSR